MKQIFNSKWNSKLLPLLTKQKEVSLYDIVKLASEEYISGTKYIGDFLDYFIYQPDNSLTQEQNNLVLRFIETLMNPHNFKENSSKSIKAFHSFDIRENLSPENYRALHDVYWPQATLKELFINQDASISQFENCFIFGKNPTVTNYTPTYYFQDQFSYFEASCLMIGCLDTIDAKELYEENPNEFHKMYPQFKSCYNFLKKAKKAANLPADTIPAKVLKEYLEPKFHIPGFTDRDIYEVKTSSSIHPALDPSYSHHAPELIIAINAWEAKYLDQEYPYHDHTPSITNILNKKDITQVNLVRRICAITNPKK